MKRLIVLVILVLFIFSGCNTESDMPVGSYPAVLGNTKPDIDLDDTLPDSFEKTKFLYIFYPITPSDRYSMLGEWQDYIKEEFGIEIYVHYKLYNQPGINYNDCIRYLNSAHGFSYGRNTQVFEYSKAEESYDLSPYYKKYDWDLFVDRDYMDALTINDAIYAVPALDSRYMIPRYYNMEYLTKLGVEVPETISEFYEYLKATKSLDSNDSVFYPICVVDYALTQSTSDIFRAFDVYFNSGLKTAVSYNPNTGTFEDGVFSDNIELSLEFIGTLQKEGLMRIFGNSFYISNDELINIFREEMYSVNKNFASEYNFIYNTKRAGFLPNVLAEPDYESKKGYYLTGVNTENVCEVRNDIAFYVFPKTIQDIDGTMALFNEVFTDRELYADFKYGIKGTDYSVVDDNIVIKPPQFGEFLDLKLIKPVVSLNENTINNIPENLIFEKNVFNQFYVYLNSSSAHILSSNDSSIDCLFNMMISTEDAIEEYRTEFRKSGKLAVINELNGKLGAVTKYNYND